MQEKKSVEQVTNSKFTQKAIKMVGRHWRKVICSNCHYFKAKEPITHS